jgi:hypothetical protein
MRLAAGMDGLSRRTVMWIPLVAGDTIPGVLDTAWSLFPDRATPPALLILDDVDVLSAELVDPARGHRRTLAAAQSWGRRIRGCDFRLLLTATVPLEPFGQPGDSPVWELLPLARISAMQDSLPNGTLPDRRRTFWKNHATACALPPSPIPPRVRKAPLFELMARPLFAGWIVSAQAAGVLEGARVSNVADLLRTVPYVLASRLSVPAVKTEPEAWHYYVERVMEEIALMAGEESEPLSLARFENACQANGLGHLVGRDVVSAHQDVATAWAELSARLFTIESFTGEGRQVPVPALLNEHLLARRLLRGIRRMHDEVTAYGGRRWTVCEALSHWYALALRVRLTAPIMNSIVSELGWEDTLDPRVARYVLLQWQRSLGSLFAALLGDSEMRGRLRRDSSATARAEAAEVALLFILNACGRETGVVSDVVWPTSTAVADWLTELESSADDRLRGLALRHLNRVNLRGQDLSECDLTGADLAGGMLRETRFRDSCLRGVDFSEADSSACDLSGADLRQTRWGGSNLCRAVMVDANLRQASFRGAYLRDACLRNADLRGVDFTGSCLQGASLRDANLNGAVLHAVDLRTTDLQGTTAQHRAR